MLSGFASLNSLASLHLVSSCPAATARMLQVLCGVTESQTKDDCPSDLDCKGKYGWKNYDWPYNALQECTGELCR